MDLRVLPPNEWERLRVAYEECRSDDPLPLPKVSEGIIISAEIDGNMVGCVGAERTWHVSPIWIDKSVRGNGLASKLAEHIALHNTERLAEMLVTTNRHVELLVYQMGFIPIPGTIWRRSYEK